MAQSNSTHAYLTYGDYVQWPEDERWELIDGVAWNMGPAPVREHQRILGELFSQIHGYLRSKPCHVYFAPFDVRLPKSNEADDLIDTVVQPDIAVICDKQKLDDKGCRGAPDWIIEIISPGSAVRDQIDKRRLYEIHNVREYWIVHPQDHVQTIYCMEDHAYGNPEIRATKGQVPVRIFPDFSIDWALIFADE